MGAICMLLRMPSLDLIYIVFTLSCFPCMLRHQLHAQVGQDAYDAWNTAAKQQIQALNGTEGYVILPCPTTASGESPCGGGNVNMVSESVRQGGLG